MIVNTYVNYGGRLSRLCLNIPLLVHTLALYTIYHIYYNINLYSLSILVLIIIIINIEWIIVIVYEYIYLFNFNVNANLLYNMILFIFLEVVLFAGVYWMYLNFVVHPSLSYNASAAPSNNNASIYNNFLVANLAYNNNTDICLHIIISNLLILLYVTLILQLVHIYLNLD